MKRIVTLTISILLLFGSLSACTQSIATALSEQENLSEVNWYYEFFSDKDDKVAVTDNQTVLLNKGILEISAALPVSPPKLCSRDAAKPVTCSM